MGFKDQDLGIAASIFLSLYVLYELQFIYIATQKGFNSLYTALGIFGLIKLGGQISGLGFAIQGFVHWQWLIAYLVLSAEGYFVLVLTTLYFLIKEQIRYYGESPLKQPILGGMSYQKLFHLILIPANIVIIVGGTMLAGMSTEELILDTSKVHTSKILRSVGQAIFLVQSISVSSLICLSFYKGLRSKAMVLMISVIPFILVRGIYGIMSCFVTEMNYFVYTNYETNVSRRRITIYEYVLAISMEFLAANLLLLIFWTKEPQRIVENDEPQDQSLRDFKEDRSETKYFYEHSLIYKVSHKIYSLVKQLNRS